MLLRCRSLFCPAPRTRKGQSDQVGVFVAQVSMYSVFEYMYVRISGGGKGNETLIIK